MMPGPPGRRSAERAGQGFSWSKRRKATKPTTRARVVAGATIQVTRTPATSSMQTICGSSMPRRRSTRPEPRCRRGHHRRCNRDGDRAKRAQQQVKGDRAERACRAGRDRHVTAAEPDRQHVRGDVGGAPQRRRRRGRRVVARSRLPDALAFDRSKTSRRMATPLRAVASSIVSAGWMRKLAAYAMVRSRAARTRRRCAPSRDVAAAALVFLSRRARSDRKARRRARSRRTDSVDERLELAPA